MEVHLMYGIQGFIRYTYLDEVALVCGDEDFERILAGMFKAFADKTCAYRYTARFDLDSGESWAIERDDTDMCENTFSVTHSQNWNNTDAIVRMTKRQLKKVLYETYKKEGVQNGRY